MREYPKIESLYNRNEENGKFMIGVWRRPEFAYLVHNDWEWTEKIDGTNIRVIWQPEGCTLHTDCEFAPRVQYRGRTDKATIPTFLMEKLNELLPTEKFVENFKDTPLCLYGEGYGNRIQSVGKNYIPDGVSFILFDVLIKDWWLDRVNMCDIASLFGLEVVPVIMYGDIMAASRLVSSGFNSSFGNFPAEGLVGKPAFGLRMRNGNRIMVKMKTKDFK